MGERTRFEIATEKKGVKTGLGKVGGFLCRIERPKEVGAPMFP